MIKRITLILLFLSISGILLSQQKLKVKLKENNHLERNNEEIEKKVNGFVLRENLSAIELLEKETKEGVYHQIYSEGLSKTFNTGEPDLPVINRLIEIPHNYTAKVKLINYDEELIQLKDYGLDSKIIPAQPSYEKSKELKDIPFHKKDAIYKSNSFYKNQTIKFEDIGYLRDKHLGYIEISPFAYNPVKNELKVLSNIEVSVEFVPSNTQSIERAERLISPYFSSLNYQTINQTEDSKALINGPVKYVIVSDRMFEETLQPFVEWKTKKGFNVIEAYTAEIGNTTTDIQAYLQDLYDNPDDGFSPTFVLLVGDVNQVPTFDGVSSSHKTDLYYFEYTGDKLPEVFYGRFSAESIEELQPQIDKTLELEQYQMPDPSYLDNVVLVAGVDGTYASTHGNGAINYANNYYTNSDNGITSYYYLYGDDSGVMSSNNSGASASIRSYISAGVSFTNYTAHCGSSGWSDPSFNISHIDGLTNEHMYPLIIGNCCQSNTFYNNDCFGEEILMAENKGAVGYIGGSNNTYWDEDYYWGVGLTSSITANPSYEESELGAYDRFFHLNGEAKEDWYITQGQINVAGNLAVQASTSGRKTYYWEIYHLMGDPSLTPYVTVPEELVAQYSDAIYIGFTSLELSAEENAYVALSQNGILLDAKLVDGSGEVTLEFDALTEVDPVDIVITKQNRQPVIDQITVVPANNPYVLVDSYMLDDQTGNNDSVADYGETIKLDIDFKNLSDSYDALNVTATITSEDTNIVILDDIVSIGTILKSDSVLSDDAFTVQLKNKFENQHKLDFIIEISGEDSEAKEFTWESKIVIIVNAPVVTIKDLFIDDASENNNQVFEPGETVDIALVVENEGSADISDLNGIASILGNGTDYLNLNSTQSGSFALESGQVDTLKFSATAQPDVELGTVVYLNFEIDDVTYAYYGSFEDKELSIGELPSILISDEDTSIVSYGYFYDTGGKDATYSNSENELITIRSKDPNKFLKAKFLSFSVEKDGSGCYDYLKIYDGVTASEDSLIGTYCNSNIPDTIVATNQHGALTFSFYSDGSVVQSGWEAEIRSYMGYSLQATVTGPDGVIENATVDVDGITAITNSSGIANINKIPEGINIPVIVSADYYESKETSINIFENTIENYDLEYKQYEVLINLSDENGSIDGTVEFDGEEYPSTNGKVKIDSLIYGYDLEFLVKSDTYQDSLIVIDVLENVVLNIELNPIESDINFVISDGIDPIQGAIVEFNNVEIPTNIDGIALFKDVRIDTLKYIIRKTGYDNYVDSFYVEKDSTVNINLSSGTATFKVTFQVDGKSNPMYNAEVILDEDTTYTDENGIAEFKNIIEAADIPYKISKTHYKDIVGEIDIAGENVLIDTIMEYTSYQITFEVTDGVDPVVGAIVSFDSKSGETDDKGQCVMDVVYSLNRTYTVTKETFADTSGMINVDKDKTVSVTLRQFTYDVTFVVKDPYSNLLQDVMIQFNGSDQYTDIDGESVFRNVIPQNEISFTLTKEGYWDYDSTLNLVDQSVTFNARMSSTTGMSQIDEQDIKIYPNPSDGKFSVEFEGFMNENYTIKVFNLIGANIFTKVTSGTKDKEEIDISYLAKGMYFVSIETENGSIMSKRIIIQ